MLMPYSQRSPGSNISGIRSAARLPLDIGGMPLARVVAQHVRVPELVAEPGGVGQQMPQRDRAASPGAGSAGPRASNPTSTCGLGERRVDRRHRVVERQLSLLDKLQRRDRGDRLGHRGDAEHGVHRHRRAAGEAPYAKRALDRTGRPRSTAIATTPGTSRRSTAPLSMSSILMRRSFASPLDGIRRRSFCSRLRVHVAAAHRDAGLLVADPGQFGDALADFFLLSQREAQPQPRLRIGALDRPIPGRG